MADSTDTHFALVDEDSASLERRVKLARLRQLTFDSLVQATVESLEDQRRVLSGALTRLAKAVHAEYCGYFYVLNRDDRQYVRQYASTSEHITAEIEATPVRKLVSSLRRAENDDQYLFFARAARSGNLRDALVIQRQLAFDADEQRHLKRIARRMALAMDFQTTNLEALCRSGLRAKLLDLEGPQHIFYRILRTCQRLVGYTHSATLYLPSGSKAQPDAPSEQFSIMAERCLFDPDGSKRVRKPASITSEVLLRLCSSSFHVLSRPDASSAWTSDRGLRLDGLPDALTPPHEGKSGRRADALSTSIVCIRNGNDVHGILQMSGHSQDECAPTRMASVAKMAGEFLMALYYVNQRTAVFDDVARARRRETTKIIGGIYAHDMNKALHAMLGHIQLAYDAVSNAEVSPTDSKARISRHLTSAEANIAEAMLLSEDMRMGEHDWTTTEPISDVAAIVSRAIEASKLRWSVADRYRVDRHVDPDLPPIYVRPRFLELAIQNLIDNAADACGKSGRIRLTVCAERQPKSSSFVLRIEDSGEGIAEDLRERVCEAGFTTKSNGSGHGLAFCRTLAESNGGSVFVGTSLLGGALVELRIREAYGASS
ncbi:MAG: sensor histidine kinase [Planctomycetota bacterium]